jgi:putative Ig domain-containing protein
MNKMYLDVIQQRRPAINYVSPAICDAIFSSTSFPVLVLDALPSDISLTGLRFTFGSGGDFRLSWDAYPGALCYTVYKVNDATDPFGEYTIIAECITDTQFDLTTDPDFDPDERVCYLVSIITPLGEQFISPPICSNVEPDGPPDPPPVGGCIENDTPLPDGEVGTPYSVTFTPVGPAAGPQWTVTAGALPDGLTLDINSGVLSGTPTDGDEFTFTVRLTKDGGTFCEQEYDLEIIGPCCLNPLTTIPTTAPALQGIVYATQDNRIFAAAGSEIYAIDPDTNVILATIPIPSPGTSQVASGVYSPVNNRVYFVLDPDGDFLVIDPENMVVDTTISAPAGTTFKNCPIYDSTNDLIYVTSLTPGFADFVVVVLDPTTNIASILLTELEIPGEGQNFGNRMEYCPLNNQLYVPYYRTSGGGFTVEVYIKVYDINGTFLEEIPIPGATSTFGEEKVYWNPATEKLYYTSYSAVTDLPGIRVIDPTSHVTEATILTAGFPQCMNFTPGCLSLNMLQTDGLLVQYNQNTLAEICSTSTSAGASVAAQMDQATNGNQYAPDILGNLVVVLHA